MKLSTDKILKKVVQLAHTLAPTGKTHLDIGSGTGELIALLRNASGMTSRACDYTDELMRLPGQKVDIVNLNVDSTLPYDGQSFDVVTCTEVVEHLENYRSLVREAYRVTKPGGVAIFTTPNVLNLKSRLRFMFFGFWNLFGPLPITRSENFSTAGHITPVPYFYLAHALHEAGFKSVELEIDKVQRSAIPRLFVWWPFISLLSLSSKRREVKKYKTVDAGNSKIVDDMNTLKMLTGRTIIVSARR